MKSQMLEKKVTNVGDISMPCSTRRKCHGNNFNQLPLKAAAPERAIPYPINTDAGVAKRANRVEFAAAKEARSPALPVAVVNQSTASLNKKGT